VKQTDTLKSLEIVLESFLERAVKLKANRLQVIDGIDRLDDITRSCTTGPDADDPNMTDRVGNWLAEHNGWIGGESLRLGDRNRLSRILTSLRQGLAQADDQSPAGEKIATEVDRWHQRLNSPPKPTKPTKPTKPIGQKLVLRKGPETLNEAGLHPSSEDSIGLFAETLKTMTDLFKEMSHDRLHLMSVLNDALKTATLRPNREALLLSALIIYYLRQNGYMVEPFVKRLKEAERLQKGAGRHA